MDAILRQWPLLVVLAVSLPLIAWVTYLELFKWNRKAEERRRLQLEGPRCPKCNEVGLQKKVIASEVAAPTGVAHETVEKHCEKCGYRSRESYSC